MRTQYEADHLAKTIRRERPTGNWQAEVHQTGNGEWIVWAWREEEGDTPETSHQLRSRDEWFDLVEYIEAEQQSLPEYEI